MKVKFTGQEETAVRAAVRVSEHQVPHEGRHRQPIYAGSFCAYAYCLVRECWARGRRAGLKAEQGKGSVN